MEIENGQSQVIIDKIIVKEIPKKCQYIDQFISWIENRDNEKINIFLKNYASLLKDKIIARNNWNAMMFAARFGNIEAIEIMNNQYGFKIQSNGPLSLCQLACIGNDYDMIKYLYKKQNQIINPKGKFKPEETPLRLALKYKFYKGFAFLIKKGAYISYLTENNYFLNNLKYNGLKQLDNQKDTIKAFQSLDTEEEIQNQYILDLDTIADKKKIIDIIKWIRVRDLLFVKRVAEQDNAIQFSSKLIRIKKILQRPENFKQILQFL